MKVEVLPSLQGQVALVTGASRGIGSAVARGLHDRGATVYGGMRQPQAAKGIRPVRMDVTVETEVRAAMRTIGEEEGRLDILVNNAGVGVSDGDVAVVSTEEIRSVLETNLLGPMVVTKYALPSLLARPGGRIVNVSSGIGALNEVMGGDWPAYRVSKTGLNGFTAYLHGEYGPRGLMANSVCPGWVRTDMGGPRAHRSVDKGAETPIWLSTLAPGGPGGLFWRDKKVIPW